jgi:hypothetical protein
MLLPLSLLPDERRRRLCSSAGLCWDVADGSRFL